MLIKQGERLINARNWNELVKPDQILRDEDTASSTHGKFVCEPLERGYGTTIGNAMRRVLLASLQGAAFVSVKITGVQHEFTTIHGVLEDVTDVVLNIKQVRLRMDTDEPQRLTLRVDSKGPVTAAQIQANQHVTVLNPEQHIATLTEDVVLEMESVSYTHLDVYKRQVRWSRPCGAGRTGDGRDSCSGAAPFSFMVRRSGAWSLACRPGCPGRTGAGMTRERPGKSGFSGREQKKHCLLLRLGIWTFDCVREVAAWGR